MVFTSANVTSFGEFWSNVSNFNNNKIHSIILAQVCVKVNAVKTGGYKAINILL